MRELLEPAESGYVGEDKTAEYRAVHAAVPDHLVAEPARQRTLDLGVRVESVHHVVAGQRSGAELPQEGERRGLAGADAAGDGQTRRQMAATGAAHVHSLRMRMLPSQGATRGA